MRTELNEQEVAELRQKAKRHLRKRLRAVRQALPEAAATARSALIVERLLALPELAAGCVGVGSFWPMLERREVDLRALHPALVERGVPVFYPFMRPNERGAFDTGLARVDDVSALAERGQRFAEPPATAPAAPRGALSVLLVPALAVSGDGHRLGYGAGYYDATIPDYQPPALVIAVAFDFQLLPELPVDPHDVPVDVLVTDRGVHRFARASAATESNAE